ncbi:MAG: hypothetical protein WBP85_14775, partial [Terracidiphilus sp.]
MVGTFIGIEWGCGRCEAAKGACYVGKTLVLGRSTQESNSLWRLARDFDETSSSTTLGAPAPCSGAFLPRIRISAGNDKDPFWVGFTAPNSIQGMMTTLGQSRCLRALLAGGTFFFAFVATAIHVAIAAPPLINGKPSLTPKQSSLPLSFEENHGQADPSIGFLGRGAGFSVAFRKDEADLLFAGPAAGRGDALRRVASHPSKPVATDMLRMRLLGANPSPRIEGKEPLPGTANYFIGNNPANWRTSIPTFARVRYAQVYPGIDLEYYGAEQRLEFDFKLAPGADPAAIRFRLDGAQKLTLDPQGNLIATTHGDPITFHAPEIYQPDAKGNDRPVRGSFKISAGRTVSFTLGNYDHAKPLIIDPILNYSTLLAPSSNENQVALAVDSAGNAYVTGTAMSGFPTTAGAFQTTALSDKLSFYPFVAKLNSTGTALIYST